MTNRQLRPQILHLTSYDIVPLWRVEFKRMAECSNSVTLLISLSFRGKEPPL